VAREKKDVLIVDDDDGIRRLLEVALTRLNLSYDTAIDGADALAQLGQAQYQVILADLMMPRLNGEEFVHALREAERVARERSVVLIMTAAAADDLARLGNDVQAVIQKPFNLTEVGEVLQGCVAVRRENEEHRNIAFRLPDQPRLSANETSLSLRGR
jgi:two-component system, OmpR family, response regulator MprA